MTKKGLTVNTSFRVKGAWMNPEELEVLERHVGKPGEWIDKEFTFSSTKGAETPLPPSDHIFSSDSYIVEGLVDIKKRLEETKCMLSNYDLDRWSSHTNFTSLSSTVIRELKKDIAPEMCTVAWTKFYEMLCAYDLLSLTDGDNSIKTLHICEAPGGFICALNHLLKTRHKQVQWEWNASSLNPYYEGESF